MRDCCAMNGRTEAWRDRGTEEWRHRRMEEWKDGALRHERKDGGLARDEGVTELLFARGMGQAAVRSWQRQTCQTGKQSVHGGDRPARRARRLFIARSAKGCISDL